MNNNEQMTLIDDFSAEQKEQAEEQISLRQKETDFDIREYPVEVIVKKFVDKIEGDKAEIFVPDYQRELVWSDAQQSRFIESILLNLPIPYLYVADITSGEDAGRLEIVDGSQRIRTLVRFMGNELKLDRLEILDKLNGFCFKDLPLPRQLRFGRKTLRMIELIEVDEEARRQLFDRLNSGGSKLEDMEKRMGSRDGDFLVFVRSLSDNGEFKELCPISGARVKRREYSELVLRFFAYRDQYENFDRRVDEFLDNYLDDKNENGFDRPAYESGFMEMLAFVRQNFPYHFRKNANNSSVPRIRFEAIAVGVALALNENPHIEPANMEWLDSDMFRYLTRSDASNSRPRVINRIHFVRDSLLGRDVEWANGVEPAV
ncbi:DUF262 domain-containing protein [Alcanivorax sp. S6407]|uniref:DUF262 domain-containing protein n=1 Tax=Alcanivorax sp. S6407 TaxID=2926424 RepID=UPI001FF3DA65|nr:DUF262 domain-containing protein [Alcanivorax sp. S6407]MCK0154899.1 DUF262 domain-containing protein [Alcanivorax sp. S6407]